MHVCVEQELFQVNWENGRATMFFFFCFWYASSTLPEPQRCTDINDFHLQRRDNSAVSLISASIWVERGNDFCLWNAALKLCSRPCFRFMCDSNGTQLPSCRGSLALGWSCSLISHVPQEMISFCSWQWSLWLVSCRNSSFCKPTPRGCSPHVQVGPQRQLTASSAWHGATLRLCIFWVHRQDRKIPGHGASRAIMFGGVRVWADTHQKRSNLTIGISLVKAPFKPLNPGTPRVPIMEHPGGVQQRRLTSVPEFLFLL